MSSNDYFKSLIEVRNSQAVTTSLKVAKVFGKRHDHLLRAIQNLVAQNWGTKNHWFYKQYRTYRGQRFPYYLMTKDGFSLLVMGFTGKLATKFKVDFINAFNDMKHQLMKRTPVEPSYMIADPIRRAKRWIQEEQRTERLADKNKKHLRLERVFRSTNKNVLVGQLAKVICNTGFHIGPYKLFRWLRANGYLIKNGRQHNVPQQKYIDQGLFTISERSIKTATGHKMSVTPLVTPKGQQYFVKKFLEQEDKDDD